ncbi:MAG: hypothetical protein LBR17_00055 [Bacteroidales bacterium]|jgi:hypothetical protein|nr:hypothetical protein [Bacteroidales bacterium]
MSRKAFVFFSLLIIYKVSFAQNLSDSQTKEISDALERSIREIASQSTENLSLTGVYVLQIENAEKLIAKYEIYKDNVKIASKWLQLKTLANANKETMRQIEQTLSQRFYVQGFNALCKRQNKEAAELFSKAIKSNPQNVMANYQIASMKINSNRTNEAILVLYSILDSMNPDNDQRNLCLSLLNFAYNKTMVQSLAMIKEGKYADADIMLTKLQSTCLNDRYNVCNQSAIASSLEKCRTGVYDDHLKVAQRAMDMGRKDVASDFIANTFDYISRNQADIKSTESLDAMAQTIIDSYLQDAKSLQAATQYEARVDILKKAKALAEMVGGNVEEKTLKNISALEGTITLTDSRLDSIEDNTPAQGYSETYSQYIKDTLSDSQSEISKIEKDYITSSNNKLPPKSVAVEQTKTQSIRKEIDNKFFEVRSFISVQNYDKALDVLESANRLAKIEGEKKEVEKMYLAAIREITARRMSAAEYAIFQGDITKADSLVAKTQDLLTNYKMSEDKEIKRIMNSYLLSLDKKVCAKKQEEIDVYVSNIMACIARNDFQAANQNIERAMQIKGSSQCRLDKNKVRSLKRQIDKPLEYVDAKEKVYDVLEDEQDTMKFIFGYAGLEQFYIDNYLADMKVRHEPLRTILYAWNDDKLVIKSIEYLMKYRKFEVAVSLVGTLKDFGYKKKHTKDIQQKLGEMIALENLKNAEKVAQYHRLDDMYKEDSWFSYFNKSYNKNYEKWKKENKFSFD